MRNQRNNFIPVPTKPVRNIPKPLPRVLAQRKSSSSQTERVVLVKEENLSFHPCTRFGQNDGGMRRDYVKAVNYINSCHKFINTIIEKNNSDGKAIFLLPMVTNFIPIFPYLIGKKPQKHKEKTEDKKTAESKINNKSEERKSKSNFAVKKVPETEIPIDPVLVGDCGKILPQIQEDPYSQVADIVKEQIQQFLNNLHQDINKAVSKTTNESPNKKCKNLDIVKQRLEELSKICFLQKNIESNSKIVQRVNTPSPPPFRDSPEDRSTILSDAECEEIRNKMTFQSIKVTKYGESATSSTSESSDIKSDSDLEINTT